LPHRGLFSQADTSRVASGLAEEVTNTFSDGIEWRIRDGYSTVQPASNILQRIPHEFGAGTYLDIEAAQITAGAASLVRAFPNRVMSASISARTIMADGAGDPIAYDGASIAAAGFTTTTADLPSSFNGILAHQDRLYFWNTNADRPVFYYGATVGAITGPLVEFPLDRLGNIKGSIVCMHSLTIDASHGPNDVLFIMTDRGQCIVYEGLDPGDDIDWRLFGRLDSSPPVSRFAIESSGPDTYVLTRRGLVSVTAVIREGDNALTQTVTRPIREEIQAAVAAATDLDQFQVIRDPDSTMLLVNVPVGTAFDQFVFSIEAGGWFKWTGIPAKEWSISANQFSFTGTDGRLANWGASGDDGAVIPWSYISPWVRAGKMSTMEWITISLISQGVVSLKLTVLSDQNQTPRDIAERTQDIEILPEDETQPNLNQNHDEMLIVEEPGMEFQLRLSGSLVSGEIANIDTGMI